ncbi:MULTISPECIES: IPT/TIG domain-containing protein [Paenibacillus]|uniref:VWA domain-containing protein n=1 Tax=Paenibacillus lautus TaxID=1401 RepID=A0A1R1AZY6_PAELA|nr:IPT/TIG domain-containing protein [Paenibacillus lautus]OME91632.1 VWA domain-containing protein [Paenibacillus lautus]
MKKFKQCFTIIFAVWFALYGLIAAPQQGEAAINDYVSVTKSANPTKITTQEETEIALNITGTPPANVVMPNDVVLIIDKSGSMAPTYGPNNGEDKMTNAKEAAKGFVDLMDMTKHRVAVVDFSSSASSFPFTVDKDTAKSYINTINSGGGTATGNAIDAAVALLADHRTEAQPVIVLMTDGAATESPKNTDPFDYALQRAQAAKDAGVIFYTIALLNPNEDPITSAPNVLMKNMATTATHHHFVLGSNGLNQIYAAIVKEIGMASAYDVTVTDIVGNDFEIVPGSFEDNIPKPTVTGNTLTWKFNELKNSALTFKYKIRPVDKMKAGTFPASLNTSSITYKDYAGANRTKSIQSVNITVKLPAPVITAVTEPFGHPNGGETVTITGQNFVSGATVKFGSTAATNVAFVSSTEITTTVPAGKQGMVDVSVTNPDNQVAKAQYQYKTDPIITSITPANGPLVGGTIVSIKGQYFMSGLTVKFGDKTAPLFYYYGPDQISVKSPIGAEAGPVDVTLTNPDGTTVTVTGGFTYDAPPSTDPEIVSISPDNGVVTGGNTIYVNGKNFKNGMKVVIGSKDASTSYISATQLRVTVPAGDAAGTVDVSVRTAEGAVYTKPQSYTYNAIEYPTPTITSVTPNTGLITGGNTVYVNGTNFVNGVTKVTFGTNDVNATYVNSTTLRLTVPAVATAGKVDIIVSNNDQAALLPEGYEYTMPIISEPHITAVTPKQGSIKGGYIAYIDGENFSGGATVTLGGINASVTYINSGQLKIVVPATALTGVVDVTVTNKDGGTETLAGGFEYLPILPEITSISPASASRAGGATIYVNGNNFDISAAVSINGVNATTAYVNSTSLRVTVPASSTVGQVPLVVSLSSGQSATFAFTYTELPVAAAPVITSLSSVTGKAGNVVYIYGTNFKNKPKVYFGSVEATTVVYTSSTTIRVTVPTGNTGEVLVKVVNPDTLESNTVTYTYN